MSIRASDSKQNSSVYYGVAIGLAIVGTCLFATKSILIKLAYLEGAQPTQTLTLRMVFALPVYFFVLCLPNTRGSLFHALHLRDWALVIICGFLGYYLSSYLDFLSLAYISAQLERLALFTYPALVCIFAWLLGIEKITRRICIAIAIGWFGIALVYIQDVEFSPQAPLGLALVFGAVFSFSVYVILAKKLISTIGTLRFTSLTMCVASIFVFLHFAITQPASHLYAISVPVLSYTLCLAIFSTVIPSFLINLAIARLGATRASVFGSIGPVFTIVLAVVLLHEPYTIFHIIGTILVLISVWLVGKKPEEKSA